MREYDSGQAADGAAARNAYTDVALLALVSDGDGGALEALYDRYGRQAYALARRILGDDQLSQDVVQEVFYAIWRDSSRYDRQRGGLGSWLLAMTHHKSVDFVRREENQRQRRVELDTASEQASGDPEIPETVLATLRSERVRQALGQLSAPQREVLVFAYFGGYTQREIAKLTGVPLGTVKTRMLAGIRGLQRYFKQRGEGS